MRIFTKTLLFVVLLTSVVALPARAAVPAFVQSANASQTSGRTLSKRFTQSVVGGDLLVVGVFEDPGSMLTVTDIMGNVFVQAALQPVAADHDAAVFTAVATKGGADTVTVNAGTGKQVYGIGIHEYSGLTGTIDATATAQGQSTNVSSGNLITATPGALIFSWFTNGSNFRNEYFPTVGTGYTKREMAGSGTLQCYAFANCMESADFLAANIQTTIAAATLNVTDIWSATAIAFKPSSPSPPTPPVAVLTPATLNFPSQPLNSSSPPQIVTLTNTGGMLLTVSGITLAGISANEFQQTNTCGASLAPGASCLISITFTPISAHSAAVNVTDNATASPQSSGLTGVAVGMAIGNHTVLLTWTPSTTKNVLGYNAFRGTSPGAELLAPINSATILGSSFTDSNALAGQTYYYVVTAIGPDGIQSSNSNEAFCIIPTP